MEMIPLHKPFITGQETLYIQQVILSGSLSGNGPYTEKCHSFFEKKFGFKKVLLTNSCTDALEMSCLLLGLKPGDEILLPSYTFVSTANAFCNYGVVPVFCDSGVNDPNIDVSAIEPKITPKTKAIVVMHYAGIACEMEKIKKIAKSHNLYLIEDAALGLSSEYQGIPLGGIGDLGTFSFHQTKNITCGEGGLLVISNPELIDKAEIVWEKGTNRAAFLRGEAKKYEWVSAGSSFLTSEIHAAFLWAQLEKFDVIQEKRTELWLNYQKELSNYPEIVIPHLEKHKKINGSLFYFIFQNEGLIDSFIDFMKNKGISVSTHYRCLHSSKFFKERFVGEKLINCQKIAQNLIRLPLFTDLKIQDQQKIISNTIEFLNTKINNK